MFVFFLPVVSQQYSTGSEEEYVIKGNSATLKCKIPSFVNDFVTVDSWLDSDGQIYSMQDTHDYGMNNFCNVGLRKKLESPLLHIFPSL